MDNKTQHPDSTREQLELNLGEQLNALISASHALNVKTAALFDRSLQPAAFLIVRCLLSYGPASATFLAESTAMDRSSVSRLVTQLKHLNYVKSETHPEDRRGVLISLTANGREKALEALKEKEKEFYQRISTWEDSKLEAFIEMLKCFNGYDCED
ncbi:MarR family transcriptional regulator [Paenibacillus polymyxa]|uniref:MarR family winged helix-turn-helix transcriptional regulator n=1 Tax=Paenibacillus polymyxa TaxID=1406 RepID=UPI002AB49229|nr:MarR family transcriptional regulator [Paenibacillus polymyxa]MDY7992909.1 MarR family transcriptional regulator [Paenibacillus polymyxa]MDY8119548.1 MarR family transcriptional regulator [Paenibacillus polymyxa]